MSTSQVISFRLGGEELEALSRSSQPGESLNQTAQRLIRDQLGLASSTGMSTGVDAVKQLELQVAAVREESLAAIAQLSSEVEELRGKLAA
jgi:hypothetical protein